MAMVINTNISAINAQRSLGKTQASLQTTMQRLASGLRINAAKDDAAGIAIASRMTAQIRGLTQAARNANNAVSVVQTIEGGLDEIHNMLQRMRELAVQASDDSNTATDRQNLNDEFQALKNEIGRIAESTKYNTQNVLNGGFGSSISNIGTDLSAANGIEDISSTGAAPGTYTLVVASGTNSGKKFTLSVGSVSQTIDDVAVPTGLDQKELNFSALGITIRINATIQDINANNTFDVTAGSGVFQIGDENNLQNVITVLSVDARISALNANLVTADLTSRTNANDAIDQTQTAINKVLEYKSKLGAISNRLDYTFANVNNIVENVTAARSRVMDADFAVETANLTKATILQQAGISVLAQANQQPQAVLALLQR
jgi:flagellin